MSIKIKSETQLSRKRLGWCWKGRLPIQPKTLHQYDRPILEYSSVMVQNNLIQQIVHEALRYKKMVLKILYIHGVNNAKL